MPPTSALVNRHPQHNAHQHMTRNNQSSAQLTTSTDNIRQQPAIHTRTHTHTHIHRWHRIHCPTRNVFLVLFNTQVAFDFTLDLEPFLAQARAAEAQAAAAAAEAQAAAAAAAAAEAGPGVVGARTEPGSQAEEAGAAAAAVQRVQQPPQEPQQTDSSPFTSSLVAPNGTAAAAAAAAISNGHGSAPPHPNIGDGGGGGGSGDTNGNSGGAAAAAAAAAAGGAGGCVYDLLGVVEHSGQLRYGHYVSEGGGQGGKGEGGEMLRVSCRRGAQCRRDGGKGPEDG